MPTADGMWLFGLIRRPWLIKRLAASTFLSLWPAGSHYNVRLTGVLYMNLLFSILCHTGHRGTWTLYAKLLMPTNGQETATT